MSITDDKRAMVALWIVTGAALLFFAGFLAVAIVEEPIAALMGIGGFLAGALGAGVVSLSRRSASQPGPSQVRLLEAMADRLESLELERGRVMELEERLDFAERLLAAGQEASRLERRS